MSKRKQTHKMPVWVYQVSPKILSYAERELYSYLCSRGPDTCDSWNYKFVRKYHVKKRMIQYRLARLKDLGLIWIELGDGPHRKIHPKYFKDYLSWIQFRRQMGGILRPESELV